MSSPHGTMGHVTTYQTTSATSCLLIRHLLATLLFLFVVVSLGGCSIANRFIFSSSTEIIAHPDQYGLPYQEVSFPSENGIALHGWMVPGAPEKPLVLFFHGNAANISHRVEYLRYLNDLGLSIFIFDYRGFGKSEGYPTDEGDLYFDARGALNYLKSKGWDRSQLIYLGRSMGAAVALQLSLEAPPKYLVLEAPFTSLHDIAQKTMPIIYATVGWWSLQDQFKNLEKIPQLNAPLLLIHGDRDHIVPIEMSQKLFANAPQPKKLLTVPGAGHSNAFRMKGDVYRQAWLDIIASSPSLTTQLKDK